MNCAPNVIVVCARCGHSPFKCPCRNSRFVVLPPALTSNNSSGQARK